jgi:YbbR domain-containing protein
MAQVIEGIVNFSNLTQHDVYNGLTTGKYTMTITMSEDDAESLSSRGVKIKDYEGAKQRKFSSKFDVKVLDAEGNPFNGEVPYNSKVRIKYKVGPAHPVHGLSTYLEAVKVLEVAEMDSEDDNGDF